MDGLREAVAGGDIDERFVDGARTIARQVARTRPPQTGSPSWSQGDIDDVVFATVERVGPDGVVFAAQQAESDRAFRAWLRRVFRSTLDLRARRTPAGRVIRAMDDALREDPEQFRLTDGYWQLVDDDREPEWAAGSSLLIEVAWGVGTSMVRISADAAKTPPMAYRCDIRAVAAAVLARSGPLRKADLAEVLAYRFNIAFEDHFDYLDLENDNHQLAQAVTAEAFDDPDNEIAAQWMLDQLMGEEGQALGLVVGGATIRGLAEELGCTKYRAEVLHNRLEQKLRHLASLLPDEDAEVVTERLLQLVGQQEKLRHSTEHYGADDGN